MRRSSLPLAEVEREHIFRVLEETGGNRTRAAEILGITRQTLLNKLKMYGHPGGSEGEKGERERARAPIERS
jgi:DNA-binding NtrC family response regulator